MVNKGRSASVTSSWDRRGLTALDLSSSRHRTLLCYRVSSTQTFRISFFFRGRYRPPPSRVTPNLAIARGTLFVVNLFRLVKLAQSVLFAWLEWPEFLVELTVEETFGTHPKGSERLNGPPRDRLRLGLDILRRRRTCQVSVPARVIALGKIASVVNAAGFLPLQGGPNHEASGREQVLQFPACLGRERPSQGVATPKNYGALGSQQGGAIADDPHLADHEAAE